MSKVNDNVEKIAQSTSENELESKEKNNKKIKYNYDKKEIEFHEESENGIQIYFNLVIGSILLSFFLGIAFRMGDLNFIKSISMYLFIFGGLLLLYASFQGLYKDSPTMQLMVKKDSTKVEIDKSHDQFKLLLIASISIIIISFFISYLNKFINF